MKSIEYPKNEIVYYCVFSINRRFQMGRKKYSKELKTQIVIDAKKGQKSITELASVYGVHSDQISIGKKILLDSI